MILYIIRGLPGSGKTTLANRITHNVCEADDYFGIPYNFDASQLSNAHTYCQDKVERYMKESSTIIAVSNTFTRRWEMQAYYDLAQKYGYEVMEITLSGTVHANVHGVPNEVIDKMRARWEK